MLHPGSPHADFVTRLGGAMTSWIATLCLIVSLAPLASARERTQPFKTTTGAFFALSVSNLAESVQWYSDKLGLTVTFEAHSGNVDVTALEGGGLVVELMHDPAAAPASV